MSTKIQRLNPSTLAAPVGRYSHVTVVPKGANLYTFSGQIGTDAMGNIPDTFNAQVQNTFMNIIQVLASQNLQAEDVIKVNIWATQEIDWDFFYEVWDNTFGTDYPSMTVGYITALGLPEIQLEIEIWAAK